MDNQESRTSWDDLARELGAEVRPETDWREQRQPVEPLPAVPAAKERRQPPATRPAADWSKVNTELGLPPLPKEEKPPVRETPPPAPAPKIRGVAGDAAAEAPPASRREDTVGESRRPRRERRPDGEREQSDRGGRRGRRRGGNGEDKQARERGEREREDRGERGERERGRGRREQRAPRRDEGQDRSQGHSRDDQRDPPEMRRPPAEQRDDLRGDVDEDDRHARPAPAVPPKPPSVSLWQKIFGSPAVPPPSPVEADANDRPAAAASPESDRAYGDSSDELFGDQPATRFEADRLTSEPGVFSDETADEGVDESPDAERPRRRSRRRRGGRGRKSGDRASGGGGGGEHRHDDEMLETPGADDFDDLEGDEFGGSDFAAPSTLPGGEDEFDDESTEDEAPGRARSGGHRGIPSWDEAIGMIVQANMQTRTQRRPSGNGGPRGRTRGGRRRRKPS